MMPKEKAEELHKKFFYFTSFNVAREIALICVDEIIKSKPIGSSLEYWREVKQELEKL